MLALARGRSAAGRRAARARQRRRARRGRAARAGAHVDPAASARTFTPSSISPARNGTRRSEPPGSPSRPPHRQRGRRRAGEALARAMAVSFRLTFTRSRSDELEGLLLDARRRLEEAEDHVGLMYVWSVLGYGVASHAGPATTTGLSASEHALRHSRLAGSIGSAFRRSRCSPDRLGSRPADEALATVDRLFAETGSSCALLSPRLAARDARPRSTRPGRTPVTADARLRELDDTRAGATGGWPSSRSSPAITRLRVAICAIVCDWLEATDDQACASCELPAAPGPDTVSARPLRRGGATREASARDRRRDAG